MALQPIWMPAPSRVNWAACSYTVISMPTRRSAAAAASPPMPAPTIATDRGLAIAPPDFSQASGRPKARLRQRRAALFRPQRVEKGLHGGSLFARLHQREIIMLFGKGNETQVRRMGHRRDGHAPVGAVLRDGCRHRIMRARLIPVA